MKLGLITQVRNESPRLKEWILYHSKVIGFDHFLFYLDNTTDDSEEVLKSLQSEFSIEVKYTDKKGEYTDSNICCDDALKRQVVSFTEGFKILKYNYDWIAIMDVDEWIVPTDINNFNFKEELSSLSTNCLYLQSYSFRPPFDYNKSITEQNMFRWTLEEKMNCTHHSTGKSIFRGKICLDKNPRVGVHWGPESHEYSKVECCPIEYNNGVTGYKKYLLYHFNSHFYNGGKPLTDDLYQLYDDSITKLFELFNIKTQPNFFDENGEEIDIDNYEPMERKLSEIHIMEDDCVLELGARYGTVSVTINKKLKTKKNQVVVEPDGRVWNALEKNKKIHNCEFNIVKGFISNKKLNLTNLESYGGAGSTYIEDQNSLIPSFTIDEVKKKHNIDKFNVLFADCEGGLEIFLDENPGIYDDLRLVIFENDYTDKCDYTKIESNLKNKGFNKIYYGDIFQSVWSK